MANWVFRVLCMIGGLLCVAIEMWGSYDFMIEKYGHWNYLVAGSLVLTGLSAILPLAYEYAHRIGARLLKLGAVIAMPVALAFVFTVSIQRTGGMTDTDEAGRQQIAENIALARQEIAEAEGQLPLDKALVTRNCNVWGPICTKAKDAQAATEAKLEAARGVLKLKGVKVEDSMAKRLIAYLPFLTKEQVQLYQPMLLPVGLNLIGFFLIAIGARSPRKAAPVNQVLVEAKPQAAAQGRPKLVAPNPDVPLVKTLTGLLKQAKGRRAAVEDLYAAYAAKEGPGCLARPVFLDKLADICNRAGITCAVVAGKVFLMDMQLETQTAEQSA